MLHGYNVIKQAAIHEMYHAYVPRLYLCSEVYPAHVAPPTPVWCVFAAPAAIYPLLPVKNAVGGRVGLANFFCFSSWKALLSTRESVS